MRGWNTKITYNMAIVLEISISVHKQSSRGTAARGHPFLRSANVSDNIADDDSHKRRIALPPPPRVCVAHAHCLLLCDHPLLPFCTSKLDGALLVGTTWKLAFDDDPDFKSQALCW